MPTIPKSHEPIRGLVERIRLDTGAAVPDIDPEGPGIDAKVLVVLRYPGQLGALETGVLSPLKNNDQTAKNQRKLFAAAGLDVAICVFWNAVPWDVQGKTPSRRDVRQGAGYLRALVDLFPVRPVVVACGNEARDACRDAAITAIEICNPGMQALNRYPENREKHVAGLREAVRLASTRSEP